MIQAVDRDFIKGVVDSLVKVYGKGSAMILSQAPDSDVRDFISTQSDVVDKAIGKPGIPVGRLTTIVGNVGSGKTTLATHMLAETQRRGGVGVLIDTEYAFDLDRAVRIGVNPDTLIVMQPGHVQAVLSQIESLVNAVRSSQKDILTTIVFDSVAGTPTKEEMEEDIEESKSFAGHARLLSKGLRKIIPLIAHEKIALIFVNQQKQMIGVQYGNPNTMIAERPVGYHSTLILDIHRTGYVKYRDEIKGIECRVKVTKNKLAPPFREAKIDILFDTGIDEFGALLAQAVELALVKFSRGWYEIEEEKFRATQWREILQKYPELERTLRSSV